MLGVKCKCFTTLNNATKSPAHGLPVAWDSHTCCSCCDRIDAIAKWNDCLTKTGNPQNGSPKLCNPPNSSP